MRRALSSLLRSGAAAVAVALLLAQSGLAGARGVSVQVTPAVGDPGTIFVVSFRAPVRTGVIGSIRLRNELTATSSSASKGCLAQVSAPVPDARRGQRVRVRLDPKVLGGRWCAGRYRGSVLELQTAVCPRGTMCPTYVRLVGTVARFSLIVRTAGPRSRRMRRDTNNGALQASPSNTCAAGKLKWRVGGENLVRVPVETLGSNDLQENRVCVPHNLSVAIQRQRC
jgi:hypothetical protein